MTHFLVYVSLAVLLIGHPVNAAEPLNLSNVTGPVQQWRPDSATITVGGKTYEMPDGVEFMDGTSKNLSSTDLKSGVRVMLMIVNGKVTHVIINPIQPLPFDLPSR